MKNLKQLSEADLVFIERYFDYDLTEQEVQQFYSRLDSDSTFEKEVGKFKKAHQAALQVFQQSAIPQQLRVEKEIEVQQPTKIVAIRKWLSVAASFIGLLTIGFWFTHLQQDDTQYAIHQSSEMVHKLNLDNLDKVPLDRRGDTTKDSAQTFLAVAFRNKDYQKCIQLTEQKRPILNSVMATDSLLVRAISFLELSDFDKAEVLFKEALTREGGYKDIALWGLVNVNLKQQQANLQQARNYLEQLATPTDDLTENINQKAKELLDRLPE